MPSKQSQITNFVDRSFRDVADKDYINARISHRYGLEQQFLWSAQQAIEKYLKAILLYNRLDTRQIGHELTKAFDEVRKIPDIDFDFPEDIRLFIEYLNSYGVNRYFEYPYHLEGEECLELDKTVWFIRRYCYYLRQIITKPDGTVIDLFPLLIKRIQHPDTLKKPHKYYIFGGYLEKVLEDADSELRSHLIYKNFFYGKYKKKRIRNYDLKIFFTQPTHFMYPEIFPDLDKLVIFSKEVRNHFNKKSKSKKP
jgi:HEPN domain-containing protein